MLLEGSVRQVTKAQEDIQEAMATWSHQWEDRLAGVTHGLEEWRQRWEETLRQAMAISHASQKSLEDLTKTMWDLSRKVAGN